MKEAEKGYMRLAAALRYEPGRDRAPRLVAAGRGLVAENIIARAREAGVPVQEDPALAGALCSLELGQEIPPELYEAVARVLAFLVYLDQRAAAGGPGGKEG